MTHIDRLDNCPVCNVSWDGGEIPENNRRFYSPPYRWSRIIGIETDDYDGISFWECPDCKARWDRFTGKRVDE